MSNYVECKDHYLKAVKTANKEYRHCVQRGTYPYLQALDEILPAYTTAGEVNLGLINIPIEKIVGTKTRGRTQAFTANFMPLLSEESEFGLKWRNLCSAHLGDTGIREPITCYEFLGRFYVQEGNKRVSVLKYFGSASIPGNVIRILPGESELKEVLVYKEFLSFYPLIRLYEISFTQLGGFAKLQAAMGYDLNHAWTEEERRRFLSGHCYFSEAFYKLGGRDLSITTVDALLEWLKVYPFGKFKEMSTQEIYKSVEAMWSEIVSIGNEEHIEFHTKDITYDGKNYRNRRAFSLMPSYLNMAFLHELKPEDSNWIRAHEEGIDSLVKTMGDQVVIQRFSGVGTGEMAEKTMEIAIKNGAEIIFTTTAPMITASRRVSARHPEVKFFNCSVGMPYSEVHTYYCRIYEGKFISGAIAGALSKTDHLGYIASYPIYGVTAGINAFALGAQLTRPNAKIHLTWACTDGDPVRELKSKNVDVISTLDLPIQTWKDGQWGTFRMIEDGEAELLASPYWNWSAFYIQIAKQFLSRAWEGSAQGKQREHAVNFWWGIASGVVGIHLSEILPEGTKMLVNCIKAGFKDDTLDPFHRQIVSQDNIIRSDGNKVFSPEEILHMDWLCENVYGDIPDFQALNEKAKAIVRLQGIYRDQIPPNKQYAQI